jgi:hypothetical protein
MNFWLILLLIWTGLSIPAGILLGNVIAFRDGADALVTGPRVAKVKNLPSHHPHPRARKRLAPTTA